MPFPLLFYTHKQKRKIFFCGKARGVMGPLGSGILISSALLKSPAVFQSGRGKLALSELGSAPPHLLICGSPHDAMLTYGVHKQRTFSISSELLLGWLTVFINNKLVKPFCSIASSRPGFEGIKPEKSFM